MKNEFKKIQSQFHKESILKIITGALAFGLMTLGVVVFLLRLKEITLSYLLYVAIFLGATLVGGGVLTLCLYKSEKRIARRIDEKYHLHESVQTMVEYKDVDGALVGLQRADAERRLERIPRNFEWKRFWQYLALLGLAIAIFICAVFVPLQKEDTDDDDDDTTSTEQPFALTDYHRLAIANLIEEVENSQAEQTEREQIVDILEKLLVDLEKVTLQAKMKTTVTASMLQVDGVADVLNTCDDIYKTLSISEVACVDAFAVMVATTDIQLLNDNIATFKKRFENDLKQSTTVETLLDEFVGTARAGLTLASTTVSSTDALLIATKAVVDGMESVAQTTGATYEQLHTAIDTATAQTKGGLELALSQQYANRRLTETVIDILQVTFELSDTDLPDFNNDFLFVSGGGGEESGEENGNDGGLSSNEKAYGSDDEIFDPDTGTYKKYGDLIVEYQGYINEIESKLSEELREYYNQYFDYLRDSQDNE